MEKSTIKQAMEDAINTTFAERSTICHLDEATSTLHTVTENEIQAALNSLKSNRTTSIIAHRLLIVSIFSIVVDYFTLSLVFYLLTYLIL